MQETQSAGFEKQRVTWDADGWSADNTSFGLTGGRAQEFCFSASAHLNNYYEMRTHSNSTFKLLVKKREGMMHHLLWVDPGHFS